MGTVITNRDRGAITKQLLDRALADKRAALKAAESKLFDECCDAFVGKHKATIEALPGGYMAEQIKLVFPYTFEGISLSYSDRDIEGAYSRRLPAHIAIIEYDFDNDDEIDDDNEQKNCVKLPKPMRKKCAEFFKLRQALDEEEDALKFEIDSMLSGIRSWKKLFEIWPELGELKLTAAPPETVTGKQISVNLPALNKKLRLPPGEQES